MNAWNLNEQTSLASKLISWSSTARHGECLIHSVNEYNLTISFYQRKNSNVPAVSRFLRNIENKRDAPYEEEDLLLIDSEDSTLPLEYNVEQNWQKAWIEFAKIFKCSYVTIQNGSIERNVFCPLFLRPHFLPLYAVVIGDDFLITVTQILEKDWIPLEIFLRFNRSHIRYESQVLQFFTVSIAEIYSQLFDLNFYSPLNVQGFHVDKACWLLYNPIEAVMYKEKNNNIEELTGAWVNRKISNYEYLTRLSELSGRKFGDVHNHYIFPWVCDFSSANGGWRDLSKTKYRLNKGDDQLKEMYSRSPPHHVPELISDIGYMVYRARVEPKEKLCKHVRSKWVPLEYPVSIKRMYDWTPDECIPEFFSDPTVFESHHPDMPSLELPEFASNPKEFIVWHRKMLESDEVSSQLHNWIDLTYGYLLTGSDAVKALNCHLAFGETPGVQLRRHGVVQLFRYPHPKRSKPKEDDVDYLYRDQLLVAESISACKALKLEEKKEEVGELLGIYHSLLFLKEMRYIDYYDRMREVLKLMATIFLAPFVYGLFDDVHILKALGQSSYSLPTAYRTLLRSFLLEKAKLPKIRSFLTHVFTNLRIPAMTLDAHDHLASFYSYHLLRNSPLVHGIDKREQNILVKELDSLRQFIVEAEYLDFISISIFERLIHDRVSCITSVYCLFNIMCKRMSMESLQQLLPSLASLLSHESSIKLIDRRFLLSVSVVYGTPTFLDRFLPALVEAAASKHMDRSIVAKDSLLWLSKRLGPVVTVRFITSNLLRILSSCFDGLYLVGGSQADAASLDFIMEGDEWCQRVESALAEIALSYSITFVTVQYLPFCVDFVDQCFRRMNSNFEGGLIAIYKIISLSVKVMNDHELMNYLEDFIIDKVLLKIISHSLLQSTSFTSERSRIIVLCRAVLLLYTIAVRIGADNTRMHAKKPFEVLFKAFDEQCETTGSLTVVKKSCPNASSFNIPLWFISAMIDKFASLWGVPLLSALCPNPPFLVPFISSKVLASAVEYHQPTLSPIPSFNFGGGSSSGNRLFSLSSSSPSAVGGVGTSESGSLSSIWCARVSSTACSTYSNKQHFRFDHLSLCSFEGHSSSIRCLEALSNENSYISGSSDKTIKLWSMNPEYEKVEARWTYRGHTRPILDLMSLHDNFIASTDGTIHIWDPFRGCRISQIDWNEGTVCGLARIDRSTIAAISSLHSTVRLYDMRNSNKFSEIQMSPTSGLARAISIKESGARMIVAHSNGTIVVSDARTGKLCSLSHGNNTHPTSINWLSDSKFLVTDADDAAVIYSSNPRIVCKTRLSDIVSYAHVSDKLLTTIQPNNILRVYKEDDTVCLEARLKSDTIPGVATSALHLPLNNAFLIGTTQGSLKLMC